MAPRLIRFRVRIRAADHGDMPGFLDMLRYEGGRVVDWGHAGATGDPYLVTIEVEAHRYVPDRWLSFGIRPEVIA